MRTSIKRGSKRVLVEPGYVVQTFEKQDNERAWLRDTLAKGREEGYTFFRFTMTNEPSRGLLVEGWHAAPPDQGEPRWQLTRA